MPPRLQTSVRRKKLVEGAIEEASASQASANAIEVVLVRHARGKQLSCQGRSRSLWARTSLAHSRPPAVFLADGCMVTLCADVSRDIRVKSVNLTRFLNPIMRSVLAT